MKWLLLSGIIALAAAGVWLAPKNRSDREGRGAGASVAGSPGSTPHHDRAGLDPVGTSGTHDGAEDAGAAVLREIETITGANDAMTLIGRRVDLHVDVQERSNDHSFWVGSADNRVLVVLGRDTRGGAARQHGSPSTHWVVPVRRGQRAAISGVVRPMPKAEEIHGWDLTEHERKDLADRKVYIRADTVASEGHGTF